MYVDALYDKEEDLIRVVERVNGKRSFRDIKPDYSFYYPDKNGPFNSIFGSPLEKVECTSRNNFYKQKENMDSDTLYESDLNILYTTLYNYYHGKNSPTLNIGMIDIEVDFNPDIGFAGPENPYAPINAISVHSSHLDTLFTLALPPKTMTWEEAKASVEDLDNVYLFKSEAELLKLFLDLIEDIDLLSGWNSTGYDIPYIVLRVISVLGEEYAKKLCLWNKLPVKREYEQFNKKVFTYDLVGRVHLDYLELYKKNTYSELHSYKLDSVADLEIGEKKVEYEGSLFQLYNQDFRKFIIYNRQDTMLLVKIDQKKKFIMLHNQLAHSICVDFKATLGSVAIIDQAIVNETHERGFILFDKRGFRQEGKAAGAYVRDPVLGLHKWVGNADINSLYPSTIRALNMSPETVLGQVRPTLTNKLINDRIANGMSPTDAWHEMFGTIEYTEIMSRSDVMLTVDFDKNGVPKSDSVEMSANEIYEWVFSPDSKVCISANGTIFRTDVEGVIPGLLARWYDDRKSMKKKASKYYSMAQGIEISEELASQLIAA